MGLDMMLYEKIKQREKLETEIKNSHLELVEDEESLFCSWRKDNQIHNWFVTHIQNGKDDCESYNVPFEKLLELKELCEKNLKEKTSKYLPPKSGFFFGDTAIDEYYFAGLKRTVDYLSDIDKNCSYIYRSCW